MTTKVDSEIDKRALWTWLKRTHPSLAQRIEAANSSGSAYVCLKSVDPEARRLVWDCLRQQKPDTATFLEGGMCQALRKAFGGLNVSLTVEDVVGSMMAEAPHKKTG